MPAVSVIVPFYGAASGQLAPLLASLQAQDYAGPVELIVVDNNDQPVLGPELLPPNGRLLHEPTPGSYAARNAGAAIAAGEVLAFTDADCVCAREWLRSGVATLLTRPLPGAVGGAVLSVAQNPARASLAERYDAFFHMRQAHYIETLGFAATANCLLRRSVFLQLGGFDLRYRSGGDRDFGARLAATGLRLAYAPEAVVLHEARRLGGLILKARRLAGQEWIRAGIGGGGLGTAIRADLGHYRLRLGRLADPGESLRWSERLGFAVLCSLLEVVRLAELARLAFTGGPVERR